MTTIESYAYDNCIRERNNYYQNYEDALEEIAKLKEEIEKLKQTIDDQEYDISQLNGLVDYYSSGFEGF